MECNRHSLSAAVVLVGYAYGTSHLNSVEELKFKVKKDKVTRTHVACGRHTL